MLPAKTTISDAYPLPSNATMNGGVGNLWDFLNQMNQAAEIDVASAGTIDLGGQLSTRLNFTGTTSITSFGTNYRGPVFVRFSGAMKITYNATAIVTPRAQDILTEAGDTCWIYPHSSTSGTADGWQIGRYKRQSQTVLMYGDYTQTLNAAAPSTQLRSFSLPAGFFTIPNRMVKVRAWGTTANTADGKTLNFLIYSLTLGNSAIIDWELEGRIMYSATANQQKVVMTYMRTSNRSTKAMTNGVNTITNNSAVSDAAVYPITVTGLSAGSVANGITCEGMTVEALNW